MGMQLISSLQQTSVYMVFFIWTFVQKFQLLVPQLPFIPHLSRKLLFPKLEVWKYVNLRKEKKYNYSSHLYFFSITHGILGQIEMSLELFY